MNNTPTPRTDDGGRYCIHQRRERWIKQPTNTMNTPTPRTDKCLTFDSIDLCETLERELTAVTEKLTAAREELADWHNAAEQVKAEYPDEVHCSCVAILRKQLKDVTKQRDRLAATIERLKELPDTWRNECQGNWLRGGVVLQLADDFDAAVKGGADE